MAVIYHQPVTVFLLAMSLATTNMATSQQTAVSSSSCPCNVMAGPAGPQGVAGPPGATGPAGPTGVGVQGPQGKTNIRAGAAPQ